MALKSENGVENGTRHEFGAVDKEDEQPQENGDSNVADDDVTYFEDFTNDDMSDCPDLEIIDHDPEDSVSYIKQDEADEQNPLIEIDPEDVDLGNLQSIMHEIININIAFRLGQRWRFPVSFVSKSAEFTPLAHSPRQNCSFHQETLQVQHLHLCFQGTIC